MWITDRLFYYRSYLRNQNKLFCEGETHQHVWKLETHSLQFKRLPFFTRDVNKWNKGNQSLIKTLDPSSYTKFVSIYSDRFPGQYEMAYLFQ